MANFPTGPDVRTLGGMWWTPDAPGPQFAGTLTIAERGRPSLAAIDPPHPGIPRPNVVTPVLHGLVDGIGAVSLLNCVWAGLQLSGTHTVTIQVGAVVTGVYLDSDDDPAWRRVEVSSPSMGALLGAAGQPVRRPSRRARRIIVSIDPHERTWSSSDTGVTATFGFRPSWTEQPLGTSVKMMPTITLRHPRPQSTDFWLSGWVEPLNKVLEIACGVQVNPNDMSLWPQTNARGIKREQTRCHAYLQGVGGSSEPRKTPPMFLISDLKSDDEQIAMIVNGATTLTNRQAVFTSLITDALRYDERPLVNRFLDVVSGLEAFHSVTHGRGPIAPDVFRQQRKDVLARVRASAISPADVKFIRDTISPISLYTLSSRLKALGQAAGVDTKTWTVSRDRVANLRNAIAHGSPSSVSKELETANEQVVDLARRLALSEIGIVLP